MDIDILEEGDNMVNEIIMKKGFYLIYLLIYLSYFLILNLLLYFFLDLKNKITEVIKHIYSFIDKNKIKIEENKINLKIIILSP